MRAYDNVHAQATDDATDEHDVPFLDDPSFRAVQQAAPGVPAAKLR